MCEKNICKLYELKYQGSTSVKHQEKLRARKGCGQLSFFIFSGKLGKTTLIAPRSLV